MAAIGIVYIARSWIDKGMNVIINISTIDGKSAIVWRGLDDKVWVSIEDSAGTVIVNKRDRVTDNTQITL